MDRLGPLGRIPVAMLRPDLLLCCGEDPQEWQEAQEAAGLSVAGMHAYRGVRAVCDGGRLSVLAPWGSAAAEGVLWELTGHPVVQRAVLWGTAGELPGSQAPRGRPVVVEEAVHVGVAAVEDGTLGHPSLPVDLPGAVAVSTDRFYGASPAGTDPRYGYARLWRTVAPMATIIDMESAPFYHMLERFAPHVARAAVRVVANGVERMEELNKTSPAALREALRGALQALDAE